MTPPRAPTWHARLPFFYGWVIVAAAFVTMAVGVSARTSFSLLFPQMVAEFGWDRGLAAGAFSFGFLFSAGLSPLIGHLMDRRGPLIVVQSGIVLLAAGLLAAAFIERPWHLYATLGVLVGGGSNCMSYTAQSEYLPNWFARRRGLALSVAFSGAGVGAIVLLPWFQAITLRDGWREACWTMSILAVVVLVPVNLVLRRGPHDVGLLPDGDRALAGGGTARHAANVVDREWASIDWTLGRALRTRRFWWIALGFFCALFAWYAVQVHQTKYLVDAGYPPMTAAWALGLVSVVAIPGQIGLGALSDRIGREWIWTAGCAGFAASYALLVAMESGTSPLLLYAMVIAQGTFGYALTSVMGPVVAEIFEGPRYGSIFGSLTIASAAGGAAGPWVAGIAHDQTGSYRLAFVGAMALCAVSAVAIWRAAPRQVRTVPGRTR